MGKSRQTEKQGRPVKGRGIKAKAEQAGLLIRIIQGEMAPGLRGNQSCLQRDWSWHNTDTVLFDVPLPSVLYVVFYLPLK